jgi:hypothetical protein
VKSNLPAAVTLPAGLYIVTDPCYAYPKKHWDKFCNEAYTGHTCNMPDMFSHRGGEFYAFPTAFGDGIYSVYGPMEGDCAVDSGTLALIPVELIEQWRSATKIRKLMKRGMVSLVELHEETALEFDGGNLKFGDYEIITDGSDLEDEEDDEDYGN